MFDNTISRSQPSILNLPLADAHFSQNPIEDPSYTLYHQTTQTLAGLFFGLIPAFEKIIGKYQLALQDGTPERLKSAIDALRIGDGSRAGEHFQEFKKVLDEMLHAIGKQAGLMETECTAWNQELLAIIEQICEGLQHSGEGADDKKLVEFMQEYSARLDETTPRFSTLPGELRGEIYSHFQSLEQFKVAADLGPTYRDEVFSFLRILNTTRKNTLIEEAITNASEAGIRFGIESGAIDVNRQVRVAIDKDNHFTTSLLGLAAFHDYLEIVEILLEKGADPHSGISPLTTAALKGHLNVVKVLLKNVRDLDLNRLASEERRFFGNRSAVSTAAGEGHVEIVEVLLLHGADPEVGSRSVFHAALANYHRNRLASVAIVKSLLQIRGIDATRIDRFNWTTLMMAQISGYTEIVELLKAHQNKPALPPL